MAFVFMDKVTLRHLRHVISVIARASERSADCEDGCIDSLD
jgi:hypothetical protein